MRKCYGCSGLGWVDSQFSGRGICPICKGSGEIEDGAGKTVENSITIAPFKIHNANPLLGELEAWLYQQPGITRDAEGKTMNGYYSESTKTGYKQGLVWITTRGDKRICLRKGDYNTVDPESVVQYVTSGGNPTYGGYPQFKVKNHNDLELAKKLIIYAKETL